MKSVELFSLMVLTMFGSAILLDVARDAGRDGWIVFSLGTLWAVVLYGIYIGIFFHGTSSTLIGHLTTGFGKYMGWFFGFLYVVYFLYIASRILRDFAELLGITSLINTGILLIALVILLPIAYGLLKGIHGLARASLVSLVVVGLILGLIVLGEFATGLPKMNRLLPVLENGWRPVFQTLFPTVMGAPFGELIVFTMIFPHVKEKGKVWKYGVIAIFVSGFLLAASSAIHISILGETLVRTANFPILSAASLINIVEFIYRINAIIVFGTVILGFMKISLFFYAGVAGTAELFQVTNWKKLVFPLGFIVLFLSIASSRSFVSHVHEGFSIVPFVLHLPFQVVIPILLLLMIILRKYWKLREKSC